jgi:nitrate reductase NapAB chaperone NapD
MAIASVVVATEAGAAEAVLADLALLPDIKIYGSKENQIVTVLEAASVAALTEGMQRLAEVEHVIGVYPVYAGNHE